MRSGEGRGTRFGAAAGFALLLLLAAGAAAVAQEGPSVAPPAVVEEPPAAPMAAPAPVIGAAAPDGGVSADAAAPDAGALPVDLSPWGMFQAADAVVKAVMIGLAVASVATWTIAVAKSLELLLARWRLRRGLAVILSAPDLKAAGRALAGRRGPAARMIGAAEGEAARSPAALDGASGQGVIARVGSHLGRIEVQAGRGLSVGTGVLATIGATAPFVGLFGTVWGIMNSFIGISESQTTSLAVVAPGIAEALLATALGLIAAIPAVVIYNLFARSIAGYRALLADAAAGVERLVSRDLDHRRLGGADLSRAAA